MPSFCLQILNQVSPQGREHIFPPAPCTQGTKELLSNTCCSVRKPVVDELPPQCKHVRSEIAIYKLNSANRISFFSNFCHFPRGLGVHAGWLASGDTASASLCPWTPRLPPPSLPLLTSFVTLKQGLRGLQELPFKERGSSFKDVLLF